MERKISLKNEELLKPYVNKEERRRVSCHIKRRRGREQCERGREGHLLLFYPYRPFYPSLKGYF